MKPESRLDIIERHVAEAEAAVSRQARIILELQSEGHPTKGAEILLALLEDILRNARDAQSTMRFRRGQL